MATLDPRLGYRTETEHVKATKTLSGQGFDWNNDPQIHGLRYGWYCVLDTFPRRDFDANAEIEALKELIPPVKSEAVEKAADKQAKQEGKA